MRLLYIIRIRTEKSLILWNWDSWNKSNHQIQQQHHHHHHQEGYSTAINKSIVLSVIYSYIPNELPEENRPYALNTVVDNVCHLFYRPMIKWVAILSRAYVHVSFIKFIDFGGRKGPSAQCTHTLSLSLNFLLSHFSFSFCGMIIAFLFPNGNGNQQR